MESHLRSVMKGLSWRVLATVVTTVVVFFYTGEFTMAVLVGSTDALTKIALYWAHERVWLKIRWERAIPSPSSP